MRTLKEKKFTYYEIILHNTNKIYIPSGFEHTQVLNKYLLN